ncbi:BtpA/SgcQ family protein [Halorientalis brevis]|uniref:BtpA/SgcQ family protein n=1 Tax=Halorientalis brevis TaxID=1126241 RepID=A0ABD6CDF2_9EURY|nr:BtpA/SgcQ family protein [Halorientalis brevis]
MPLDPTATFGTAQPVVGMVHLPALPGAPGYDEQAGRAGIRERALADARALADGGVDGLVIENYGDAPFYPESVPEHVVADMTCVAEVISTAVDLPLGINVLRNDATAALSVAAAVDADFVRVNVHTGARVTDQGVIEGRAHETLRLRDRLDADVAIFADVAVKHSAPLGNRTLETAVADVIDRGNADGLIVSGPATGRATETTDLRRVTDQRDDVDASIPVFVGSGVTPENVGDLLSVADGAIVGTALKTDGVTTNPVDPERVSRIVAARDR